MAGSFMNIQNKRLIVLLAALGLFFSLAAPSQAASPWTKETTYGGKTLGKLGFGLKNTLFGWMTPWNESWNPKYPNAWTGFSAGIGGMVVNTTAGLVQLSTFFIPVDFPDVGYGLRIPDPDHKTVPFTKSSKK